MKYILNIIFLFVTISLADAQTKDKDDIKKVFDGYKSAILNDKADEALNSIDNKTINYYKSILSEVKTADSNKISAMSLVDRITVLGIRARATKQEIIEMQG